MEKALTTRVLAFENIKRKPYRTAALITVVALSAAVLFANFIITSSLKGGIKGLKNRLGADLMIVPQGYENQMENVLLSGEPNYFYMDKSIENVVQGIQGVGQVSSQFYLTSLSESCCDFAIQIIGFDPQTDFIVQNWAEKNKTGTNQALFYAGSNIITERGDVTFFGSPHHITSKLSKSGSGMDNAIYTDLNTLQQIFEDAKTKGFGFISDGDTSNKISTIFVKLADGAKADSTALRIKTALPQVQVIQGGSFISNLGDRIAGFLIFPRVLSLLILLISVFTLAVVFSLIVNERIKEYSILRVLGADSSSLKKLIVSEAGAIGLIGSAAGLFLAALTILPFNVIISEKIGLPFALANPLAITGLALTVGALSTLSCLAAAFYSTIKISKKEVIFK